MSSLLITVKSSRTGTDLADRWPVASLDPKRFANHVSAFFASLAGGVQPASSVDLQVSSADPVAATGTFTITYASVANNDTVTCAGVTLTCVTGTPTGAQFKKQTDGPTTATNLATLINTNATTSTYVYASASGSVVTVTALVKHALGNLVGLTSSNGTGIAVSAATLTGGAGSTTAATLPVSYAFGL